MSRQTRACTFAEHIGMRSTNVLKSASILFITSAMLAAAGCDRSDGTSGGQPAGGGGVGTGSTQSTPTGTMPNTSTTGGSSTGINSGTGSSAGSGSTSTGTG